MKTIRLSTLPPGQTLSCRVRRAATLELLDTIVLTEEEDDDETIYAGTMADLTGQLLFEILVAGVPFTRRVRTITEDAGPWVIVTDDESTLSAEGAWLMTIEVVDAEDAPITDAIVRVSSGPLSEAKKSVDGEVRLSADSGTYTVTITKHGYASVVDTLSVSGPLNVKYSLAQLVVTQPTSALVSTGILSTLDEHAQPESGVTVHVQLKSGPGTPGYSLDTRVRSAVSDESGFVEFNNLIRGASYNVWSGTVETTAASPFAVRSSSARSTFTVPDADSFNIAEFLRLDPDPEEEE